MQKTGLVYASIHFLYTFAYMWYIEFLKLYKYEYNAIVLHV